LAPIYIKVKNDIKKKIEKGIFKSGEKIPSERELSQIYNVSRMTARQAVNQLANEGFVYREKGKGTFVSSLQFSQKNLKSFTETLKEQGYDPETKILEFSIVHSLKEISKIMDQPYETKFYKIKRLRLGNNVPMALETVYIPVYKCKDLREQKIQNSLYSILKNDYDCPINSVSYDIEACISNRMMMKLFQVQKPVALLKVSGVNFTKKNDKLLYEESYYRSDLYKYQVDILK